MSRFTRFARSRVSGQHEVGHEGVITGRDFSLRSSIADPQGVAQSPLQSTFLYGMSLIKYHLQLSLVNLIPSKIIYTKKETVFSD
ncbi:hypothetical protein CWD94_27790 [Lysinibacillus xylanilyticus]|uniref:Uncharacterized protein n=1 Tax=Lysinibacillus xylanilyticus TaxID=582475 RepID=A0A2M9PXF1_9BACI|nr:hypothetical protein CWD94_27790 [Lysinibacillus xylanilyticus]